MPFQADGQAREALVHLPAGVETGRAVPALIALHGYSSKAADFAGFSGLSGKADDAGFVVVYPQGLGNPAEWHLQGGWSAQPGLAVSDRALVEGIVDWLAASGCVDTARIFLAGHSQGGGMAADLGCALADRFAGVGLISGLYFQFPCQPPRAIPVFASHAVDDPVLPYAGGHVGGAPQDYPSVLPVENVMAQWAARDGCTGDPARTQVESGAVRLSWTGCAAPMVFYRLASGGHGWPSIADDAMWAFFMELPRGS